MAAEEYLASLGIDTKDADRALDQIITIVAAASQTFETLSGKLDKAERALTAQSKAAQASAKAQRESNDAANQGSAAWQKYVQELNDAAAAYKAYRAGVRAGDTDAPKNPVGNGNAQSLIDTYEAANASVITEARNRVATLTSIDAGYFQVAEAREKARAAQTIRQLGEMEAAERRYVATRTALTAAQANVKTAEKSGDEEALASALAAQVKAINDNASAYANLSSVRDKDARVAEDAASRAIAAIERESAARTASYSKAVAEAAAIDRATASSAKASISNSDTRIGASWTADDRDAEIKKNGKLAVTTRELSEAMNRLAVAERAVKAATDSDDLFAQERAMRQLANATEEGRRAQLAYNQASLENTRVIAEQSNTLPRLRYALYDVSNAIGLASAASLAGVAAGAAIAVSWEKDFSQVRRTSQATGTQLDSLKSDFTELAQTIPESYDALTKIGALGGQLDVDPRNLADFTAVVAKFSATTNVSVDESATAFGRLDALLPGVSGNYNKLGSSILGVGLNSVATESEIIAVTSQIAAAGTQAGLTADETIGLAGAYASAGIAAESARGTTLRFFSQINGAVSGSNDLLQDFAAISGKSSEQFQVAWKKDKAGAIVDILNGIGAQGPAAEETLKALGINAQRDLSNLLKLSQNTDLVKNSFDEALGSYEKGRLVNDQYGEATDNVASKLELLNNNFQALVATLGGQTTGALSVVLSFFIFLLKAVTDLANNPLNQWIFLIIGILTTLVAVLGLGAAAAFRVQASILAMRSAFIEASAQGIVQEGVLTRLATKMGILNAQTLEAVAAQRALAASNGTAAASLTTTATAGGKLTGILGKAGLLGALLALAIPFAQMGQSAEGAASLAIAGLDNVNKSVDELLSKKDGISTAIADLGQGDGGDGGFRSTKIPDKTNYDVANFLNDYSLGWTGATAALDLFNQQLLITQTAIIKTFDSGNTDQAKADYAALTQQLLDMGFPQEKINELTSLFTDHLAASASEATTAADAQAELNSQMRDNFSVLQADIDAQVGLGNSLYSLGQSLYDNGDAFGYYSAAGRENTAALSSTISSYVKAFGDDAQALANNLQALYQYILNNTNAPAAAIAMITNAIAATGKKPNGVGSTFPVTALTDGYTASANKAAQAASKASDAIKEQVVTLVDYANDLKGVFSRAFDIRFGGDQAFDKINSGWNSMAEAIAQVNAEIAQYQIDMQGLTADKSVREYWLSVAENYGDALRAGELRAELADIDNQLAEKSAALTKAQEENSKTTDGNSQAAIDNRAGLVDLVQTYEDYIAQLASSGLSQDELRARVAQLKQEFIQQATQMGYSQTAVAKYADAFDDLTLAINGVPRNITVNADTNPARQALNEFIAQARAQAGSSGVNIPVTTSADTSGLEKAARGTKLAAQMAAYQRAAALSERNDPARAEYLRNQANALADVLNSGNYRTGGYTGNGGLNDIAGVVHGKEFVLNATGAQMIPRPVLEAANQGRATYMPQMRAARGSSSSAGPDYSRTMVDLLQGILQRSGTFLPGDALFGAVGGAGVNGANRNRY